jgi:hypothetical protein
MPGVLLERGGGTVSHSLAARNIVCGADSSCARGLIKFGYQEIRSAGAGPRTAAAAAALIILFGIRALGTPPRGASRRTYKLSWKISSARARGSGGIISELVT